MKILRTIAELREWRENLGNQSLGFVPTMGALHQGHLSLLKKSQEQNSLTLLSIFVNPTQFGANEDLAKYPRTLQEDIKLAQELGVDALFAPESKEMYPSADEITLNPPKVMGYVLEGALRLGHFDGVLQIVLKLFHLTYPTRAYFGQKDAQQLLLIQKMVQDLFLPIEIVPCPIIRDFDGLALSSRNIYLSQEERARALCIPLALKFIHSLFLQGERCSKTLQSLAMEKLQEVEVQYLAFCDYSLQEVEQLTCNQSLVLLTCKVGNTRLLDNLWL